MSRDRWPTENLLSSIGRPVSLALLSQQSYCERLSGAWPSWFNNRG
jgi:hypothetical protein